MNSSQNIPQAEHTQQQEQKIIKQLKLSIELTHQQMHELVSNEEQFVQKITVFNNQAKDKIQKKKQLEISEALVYLSQAQKILEYAAGCGKNINRQLIICVLHNQACIYQILWELDLCSNYLEALIFNYEAFFKETYEFSIPPSCINPTSHSQINLQSQKMFGFSGGSEIEYTSRMKEPQLIIKAELKLLNYYYQHCAVSSQLQLNRKALQSAKKAIKILKNSLIQHKMHLVQQMKSHKYYSSQNSEGVDQRYYLLQNLSEMNQKINVNQYKQILKSVYFTIQIWSKNRSLHSDSQISINEEEKLKQKVKNLTIGKIMEILPKNFNKTTNEAVSDQDEGCIFSLEEYLLRIFFLSVGYFSVATQLRLLANSTYKNRKEQDKKNSQQYKESMIYHLIAILIATLYIPYECHYILDILASYSKHYCSNLEQYKPVQRQSIQKIILLLGFKKEKQQFENRKQNERMGRSTKQTTGQQQKVQQNDYNMNFRGSIVKKTKKRKEQNCKEEIEEEKEKISQRTKKQKSDLKSSQVKQSRADSKNSRMKRSNSKQAVNIKQKIQKKYSQLQKILSSDNLLLSEQGPKSPIKKLKSSQKQKEKTHLFSKDKINGKKLQKCKDEGKKKQKIDSIKMKVQRKTKNQPNAKQNSITQQDQQFFFYMTKRTTKTSNNLLSPKQSLKSIGSSRRSVNKKSSLHSSRSNSKNSPKVLTNIQSPVATLQSPTSKGVCNIRKINAQRKNPNLKQENYKPSFDIYKNYL